jgi:hypothetical protein
MKGVEGPWALRQPSRQAFSQELRSEHNLSDRDLALPLAPLRRPGVLGQTDMTGDIAGVMR